MSVLLVAYLSAVLVVVLAFGVLFASLPERFDRDWLQRRWGKYADTGGAIFRALRTIEYATVVSSSWDARRALGEAGVAYGFGERAGPTLHFVSRVFLCTALAIAAFSVIALLLESLGIAPPLFA